MQYFVIKEKKLRKPYTSRIHIIMTSAYKSRPIPIRLSEAKWIEYSAEAEARGMGLSTYLRDRLEQDGQHRKELAVIRSILEELRNAASKSRTDVVKETPSQKSSDTALQIETLYLLRHLAGPEKCRFVHGELERIRIEIWKK